MVHIICTSFYMAINLLCVLCSRADEEGFEVLAQLVILLRLWRIIRVVNSIILSKSRRDNALHEAKGELRKTIPLKVRSVGAGVRSVHVGGVWVWE